MGQEIVADEKAQENEVIQDHLDVKSKGHCSWLAEGCSEIKGEVLAKAIDAKIIESFFAFVAMLGSFAALAFFWRIHVLPQYDNTGFVKR
jgi:hypothetical protein